MKTLKRLLLLIAPLLALSSCYVKVENGHRHWYWRHHRHEEHKEIIIEDHRK